MSESVSVVDVAARAGVSLGTVSNVLNRPDRVAPARRDQVTQAIRELGFVRNEATRQLRAGRSRTIASCRTPSNGTSQSSATTTSSSPRPRRCR